MAWLLRMLVLLAAILGPAAVPAQNPPKYYRIALTIERDGQIIGAPTFVTEPGGNAIMANSKAGYSFRVDVGSDGGLSSASISVATELYLARNDRWELFGKPTIFAPIGKKSELSLSNKTLGSVTISYDITVVPDTAGNIETFGKNKRTESRVAEWTESLLQPVSYLPAQRGGL